MPPVSSSDKNISAAGRAGTFGRDLLAGLTLAAITIPEHISHGDEEAVRALGR
jgi:SulP family sulfate permease